MASNASSPFGWDRQRLLPGGRQLAWVVVLALVYAAALVGLTRNTYMETALARLAEQLRDRMAPPARLQWIKASVGSTVRLIPVEQVIYLKSGNKYTLVMWDGGEALIRKTIRELADALDPQRFAQIHRSAIVNLSRVSQFSHGPGDASEVHLKGSDERLAVSRSYLHLFQQM